MTSGEPNPKDAIRGEKYHPRSLFSVERSSRADADSFPGFERYLTWESGDQRRANKLDQGAIEKRVLEIVSVEGPLLVDRLIRVCDLRHRESRVPARTRAMIELAIDTLVTNSKMCGSSDRGSRTVWLPSQQPVRVRRPGPRELREIPANEIAAAMVLCGIGLDDKEGVIQEMASIYALRHLDERARWTLERAWHVARKHDGA